MSRSLGQLTIDLIARTAGFIGGMNAAERAGEKWRRQVEADMKKAGQATKAGFLAITTAATGAGATMLALGIKGINAADAQVTLASTLDTSYNSLSALKLAFDDAGVENFEGSITRLNRRLGAAEFGGGPAARAVDDLGLSLKELSKLDAAERVAAISDAILKSGASAQLAARYAQDLGFEQKAAGKFFLQGGDAVREATERIDQYGLALSEIDAAKMSNATGIFSEFSLLMDGTATQIGKQFAPILSVFSGQLLQAADDAGGMGNLVEQAFDKVIDGASFVIDAVDGIIRVVKIAGLGVSVFGKVAAGAMIKLAKAIVDSPIKATNNLINLLNKLPKVNIEAFEISNGSKLAQKAIDELVESALSDMDEINELLKREPNSRGANSFKNMIREARKVAEEEAKKIVEANEQMKNKLDKNNSEIKKQPPLDTAATDELEKQIAILERSIAVWGLSASEILKYDLAAKELTGSMAEYAVTLQETLSGIEEQSKAQEEAKNEFDSNQASIESQILALEKAAETWGMTADQITIYGLAAQGANDAQLEQAKGLQSLVSELEKNKKISEDYKQLVSDLASDEDNLTGKFKERIGVLKAMAESTGIAADEYKRLVSLALDEAIPANDAPSLMGRDFEGSEKALQEWYNKNLEMLSEFRESNADLTAEYDAKEIQLKQQHEDKLSEIEKVRKTATISIVSGIYNNLSTLASSENKKLVAIGKAAAIAQATIAGFQAVQNALAVAPYPLGVALAVSAGVSTAANIASIAGVGFKSGGYTGDMGEDEVAGVVHGKEFVFDAQSTAKIGVDNLEKLRGGNVLPFNTQDSKSLQSVESASNQQQISNQSVTVNVHDAPPGTTVKQSQGLNAEQVIDIFISDLASDGKTASTIQNKFGLAAQGR